MAISLFLQQVMVEMMIATMNRILDSCDFPFMRAPPEIS
jgi:hypothetical protein